MAQLDLTDLTDALPIYRHHHHPHPHHRHSHPPPTPADRHDHNDPHDHDPLADAPHVPASPRPIHDLFCMIKGAFTAVFDLAPVPLSPTTGENEAGLILTHEHAMADYDLNLNYDYDHAITGERDRHLLTDSNLHVRYRINPSHNNSVSSANATVSSPTTTYLDTERRTTVQSVNAAAAQTEQRHSQRQQAPHSIPHLGGTHQQPNGNNDIHGGRLGDNDTRISQSNAHTHVHNTTAMSSSSTASSSHHHASTTTAHASSGDRRAESSSSSSSSSENIPSPAPATATSFVSTINSTSTVTPTSTSSSATLSDSESSNATAPSSPSPTSTTSTSRTPPSSSHVTSISSDDFHPHHHQQAIILTSSTSSSSMPMHHHPLDFAHVQHHRSCVDFLRRLLGAPGATELRIASLPVRALHAGDEEGCGGDGLGLAFEQDTCAICLDGYEVENRVRVLSCKHVFHTSCIDPWLRRGRPTCPLCQTVCC